MSDSARPSMDLFGEALRDFFNGEHSAQVLLRRDDGLDETLPISIFFQRLPELTAIERQALNLSNGRVLDIGAGAGRHTLILQERGRMVTALDVSHDAVEVMKLRGVRNPIHGDLFAFSGGPFDTLLLLMRSVGMAGDLDGLNRFFGIARGLLSPRGFNRHRCRGLPENG